MEINAKKKQTCPTAGMNKVNSFVFPTFLISENCAPKQIFIIAIWHHTSVNPS